MIKNKQTLFKISIFFIFINFNVYGQVTNFLVRENNIKLHTPKQWQVAKNFLGGEVTLLGPVKNKRRPIIMLKYIPLKNYFIDENRLEETQEKYQAGRIKWLKKNKAKLNGFVQYKKNNWKKKRDVHTIGYSYTANNLVYIEMNYFFKCEEQVFNLSTLMTQEQLKTNLKTVQNFFDAVDC